MDRAAEAPQPSRLQSLDGEDAQRLLCLPRVAAGGEETLFPCSPTTWSGPRKATARSAASIGEKRADRSVLPADGLSRATRCASSRSARGAARPRHAAALPGPGRSRPAGKRRDPYAAAARQCHHPRQFRGGRSARGRAMAQAGAASGVEPEADAMDPQTLAIPAEELADAFEAAMIELRTLQQPPSAAVQIRLQAYEWQVRRGDARPKRPRTPMPAPRCATPPGGCWRACPLTRRGGAISPWCGGWTPTPARPYTTATRPGANCRRENRPRIRPCPATTPRPAIGPPRAAAGAMAGADGAALRALVPAGYMPDARALDAGRLKSRSAAAGGAALSAALSTLRTASPRMMRRGAQCLFAAGAPDARARVLLNPLSLPADTTPTAQPAQPPLATVAHGPPLGSRAPPPGLTRTDRAALSPRALSNRPTRGFPCVPSSCPRRRARHARPIRRGGAVPGPGRLRPGSPAQRHGPVRHAHRRFPAA